MSHFSTLVILPKDATDPEASVTTLLAPYDENLEMDPYFEECYCKNTMAERAAAQAANAVKTMEQYRNEYWATPEESRPEWQDHIKDWKFIHDSTLEAHPLKDQFNPDCEDCQGGGTRATSYNPRSKWDWWSIGGRWTGALVEDYDPAKDIENQEWCNTCGGTGSREDFVYYADPSDVEGTRYSVRRTTARKPINFSDVGVQILQITPAGFTPVGDDLGLPQPPSEDDHEVKPGCVEVEWCNGCDGKGMRVKWPTEWKAFEGTFARSTKSA
jgi:hypothetical protein